MSVGIFTTRGITGRIPARAFTLVEVLVALALVLLIAGLVLPAMGSMSETVVFKNTCDQLTSAVSVCRTEAQRRGTPMELVTSRGTDGRVSVLGRPAGTDSAGKADGAGRTSGGTASGSPKHNQLLLVLPPGYSFDDSGPVTPSGDLDSGSTGAEGSETNHLATRADGMDAEAESKPLVVFWANGGAAMPTPLFLHGRGGRVMGAEINSWTGAMRLEELPDPATCTENADGKQEVRMESRAERAKAVSSKPAEPKAPEAEPAGP